MVVRSMGGATTLNNMSGTFSTVTLAKPVTGSQSWIATQILNTTNTASI